MMWVVNSIGNVVGDNGAGCDSKFWVVLVVVLGNFGTVLCGGVGYGIKWCQW